MNLVFLSSLEKDTPDGTTHDAQVTIGEQHGIWAVVWNERQPDGKTVQEHWFEGTAWEAMLQAFRHKLQEKWLLGYSPLVEGVIEGRSELTGKSRFNAMLQCYSDLHPNAEVYERLREWRREQAQQEGRAAYLVATNRVLRMVAAFLPHTEEELAHIPWLGEQKLKQYGYSLTAITAEFERASVFPLDWVPEAVGEVRFDGWLREQRQQKLRTEQSQSELKRQLLEGVARGERMEELTQQLGLTRRAIVQLIETVDEEGYEVDPLLQAELEDVAADERKKAWRAFELEGVRYLKPVLHRMYSEQELQALDLDRVYEWLRLLRLQYRKSKLAAA